MNYNKQGRNNSFLIGQANVYRDEHEGNPQDISTGTRSQLCTTRSTNRSLTPQQRYSCNYNKNTRAKRTN